MKNIIFKILLLSLLSINVLHAQTVNLTDSNLPIVIIDTDGGATIPDEPKIGADMVIIERPNGGRNFVADQSIPLFTDYDGRIAIEVRGQSSQQFAKKQYKLELRSANDTSIAEPILGMPKESDWILHGPYIDKTLMRNVLTYELSRRIGRYAPKTRYCEVILNEEYIGVYVFMESIKIDADRINVETLTPIDNTAPEVTGGYVWKVDKDAPGFISNVSGNDRYRWHDPSDTQLTIQQKDYLQQTIEDFETVMDASNYNDPLVGYPAEIDVSSWVDQFLLQEFTNNPDAFGSSTYYHKYKEGKLRMGPIWDMNLALGSSYYGLAHYTNIWTVTIGHAMVGPSYNQKLFNDQDFRCLMGDRWFELRAVGQPLHKDSVNALIDSYATLLDEAQQRNYTKWDILGMQVWLEAPGYATRDTYQKEVDYLKDWLSDRIDWIDANIYTGGSCPSGMPEVLAINEIHYNPYAGLGEIASDFEFIEIANKTSSPVDISGVQLSLGIQYTFPAGTVIGGNGFIVLANDAAKFLQRYGFTPFDTYGGDLSNSGELLILADVYGNVLDEVRYNDKLPWPTGTDGFGASLELLDPTFDNALPVNWFANNTAGGSPGVANVQVLSNCNGGTPSIVINEIHYNPLSTSLSGDWIEFYNSEAFAIDISGCEFRDNSNVYVVPNGTIFPGNSYIVFAEDIGAFLSVYPGTSNVIGGFNFGLSNGGEVLQIYDAEYCLVDEVIYDDAVPWVVEPDGTGPSLSLLDPTFDNDFATSWSASTGNGGTPGAENFPVIVGGTGIEIKVVLEGFKISGSADMDISLRSKNLLPHVQPYGGAPHYYTGTESVITFPVNTVDWVLVELRSNTDRNLTVAKKVFLLRDDGYIMNPNGTTELDFGMTGTYYITVYHRNHMGVMSSPVVDVDAGLLYDFTNGVNQAFGIQQLKAVDTVTAMFSGDFDGNGIINNLDFNLWNSNSAVVNQYVSWDADGNGIVNNLDINRWDFNKSKVGIAEIRL